MTQSHDHKQALFAAMISGYTTQAFVALGKMANPVSGEMERDLEHARVMIDMLEMLEAKTEGNRNDQETSALRQSISTLRLNFVEEMNKKDTAPPEKEEPTDAAETHAASEED